MINFIKRLFQKKEERTVFAQTIEHKPTSITCGPVDSNSFADVYVDGEKTNVRMLMWSKEEVEYLQKIAAEVQEELYQKHINNGSPQG